MYGMIPNTTIMNTITVDTSKHFKSVQQNLISTKSDCTKIVTLLNLPSGTLHNTTTFKDWMKYIEKRLDMYVSVEGFTLMGYLTVSSDRPVSSNNINVNSTFGEIYKSVVRLIRDYFQQYHEKFFMSNRTACATCGLICIEKHHSSKNGQGGWKDIIGYYYPISSRDKYIINIKREITKHTYQKE